jgi:hypothetical protein
MTTLASTMLAMEATYLHVDKLKTQNDLDLILNAIHVGIIKEPRCDINAVQSIKWLWKPKFIADPAECEPDYGIPTSYAELEIFVTEKRLKNVTNDAAAYLQHLTGNTFRLNTEKTDSIFFQKQTGEKFSPAERWRTTAHTTRRLLALYCADTYIREGVLKGEFEDWNDFRRSILNLANISGVSLQYRKPSQLFLTVQNCIKKAQNSPDKFQKVCLELEMALSAHFCGKATTELVKETGSKKDVPIGTDQISPIVRFLIEAIAVSGMDEKKWIKAEEHLAERIPTLSPEDISKNRYKWTKAILTVARESKKHDYAVHHVGEADGWENLDDAQFEDQIENMCENLDNVLAIRENRYKNQNRKPVKTFGNQNKFQQIAKRFGNDSKRKTGENRRENRTGKTGLLTKTGKPATMIDICKTCLNRPTAIIHTKDNCKAPGRVNNVNSVETSSNKAVTEYVNQTANCVNDYTVYN